MFDDAEKWVEEAALPPDTHIVWYWNGSTHPGTRAVRYMAREENWRFGQVLWTMFADKAKTFPSHLAAQLTLVTWRHEAGQQGRNGYHVSTYREMCQMTGIKPSLGA